LEQHQQQSKGVTNTSSIIPKYELPSSPITNTNSIPSLINTYTSIDSMAYILQPFRLALPPPGYTHSLQMNLYHESFEHLYDLVIYNDGELAAKLIELFATNLYLGGRLREEIIHSGSIHTLILLLRRVLLRAQRLGMLNLSPTHKNKEHMHTSSKRLWQQYASYESPNDEDKDIHGSTKETSPTYIPTLITQACKLLINACCGPALDKDKRWKRPPLPLHIRRTSDIALTAVFALAFDLDLWGGDPIAASSIIEEVANLYCSAGFDHLDENTNNRNCPELTHKYDAGYGRLLRGQISIQHLLDIIRIRFGNEMIVPSEKSTSQNTARVDALKSLGCSQNTTRVNALKSLGCSFSRIFYTLLKYSLFKAISQGEHDISAMVSALSDCPLGSVGAHIVLTAIRDILIYCETLPNYSIGMARVGGVDVQTSQHSQAEMISSMLKGPITMPSSLEHGLKLKKVKSDIVGHLARNLLMGQFHDVVAPMLLSRTVFDGRRTIAENGANASSNGQSNDTSIQEDSNLIQSNCSTVSCEWQHHWITTLSIFIWLSSIARTEGDKAAYATGTLLLQSGKAGSLSDCLLRLNKVDLIAVMIPPIPTASSAIQPGGGMFDPARSEMTHVLDTANRLKIFVQLIGGLVASLVSNYSRRENSSTTTKNQRDQQEARHNFKSAVETLQALTNVVRNMVMYVYNREEDYNKSVSNDTRRRRQVNSTLEITVVRDAIRAVPSFVSVAVLLENPIQDCKKDFNTDKSWDFVEGNGPSIERQLCALSSCQSDMLHTAGLLMTKAMVVGGGEASTVILRDVVSSLVSSSEHDISAANMETDPNDTYVSAKVSNQHLLCRLISIVLNKIVAMHRKHADPWRSVELCSATARLCDLVEEKKLLTCPHIANPNDSTDRLSLDQVRLLCTLLDVMQAGRENTGWCQIIVPETPQTVGNNMKPPSSPSRQAKPSIVSMLISFDASEKKKFQDDEMTAMTEGIYHLIRDFYDITESDDQNAYSEATINPQSLSTSKLLLPILQPSLRIVLGSLGVIRSMVIVQYPTAGYKGNGGKSLLSIVIEELRSTITAALVGLTFPHARDVCLQALSLLRQAIVNHEHHGDEFVAAMYRDLFLTFVDEMRVRYSSERKRREVSNLFSYDTHEPDEAANSTEVERLLLGSGNSNPVLQMSTGNSQDENDDFIVFPDHGEKHGSPRMISTMGWNGYKGFGLALEKCLKADEAIRAQSALEILSSYLDTWDEKQVMDEEESEMVELFDTNTSIGGPTTLGFATAADSMTSYIELASSENYRITEIQSFLLPYKRYNSVGFAETYSWKSFIELFDKEEHGIQIFERCMANAGRDYGGRMLTVPIHPQFARAIPYQLDHSPQTFAALSKEISEDGLNASGRIEVDFDELNNLLQQGNLKILDITKKQDEDHDELDESDNVLVSKPSMDSAEMGIQQYSDDTKDIVEHEEVYLDFPDRCDEEESVVPTKEGLSDEQKDDANLSIRSINEQNKTDYDEGHSAIHSFFISSYANPPNSTSSSLQGHLYHGNRDSSINSGWGGIVEDYYDGCVHVKVEGNRIGTLLLTPTYLIFEYDDPSGLTESEALAIEEMKKKSKDSITPNVSLSQEDDVHLENEGNEYDAIIEHYKKAAALRPKSMRWNIHELSHVYLRRYRLRDSALELFFIPSGGNSAGGTGLLSALSSIWLDFGSGVEGNIRRDKAANDIMKRAPPSTVKQWPDKSSQFLHEHLRNITLGWVKGRINNFDYLLALNILSGRSFNDLCQYPVFPWVLSNYTSEEIPDLNDKSNFRDLTKPMGAINPQRLEEFIERFKSFDDAMIPPFMYGSHYSTSAGVVLHFLVRMHPFASLHRQLQGGHFDVADRLFSSVARTWDMCTGQSAAEVKELTPEWYCNPSFLRNSNSFKLGTSQEGESLGDVILPPWAKGSSEKFVEVLRCALESDICTSMLPNWIDLIFGRKQQGPASVEAHNVFFYLTYYGSVDVASIEDKDLRIATELQIAHFGQCPMQLFWRPHVTKLPVTNNRRRLSLSELLGLYDIQNIGDDLISNTNRQLMFGSAPLEYWLHLSAPPPGPHAPIIAVRLVVPDRCLAVDAQGIFHFFRFGWKVQIETGIDEEISQSDDLFSDKGVFVAQRELPHFRSIPRLHFALPKPSNGAKWDDPRYSAVVAISKCLFNRSLLVISDGDGKGALCFQFVDPAKGVVDGEVFVPSAHSSRISALHTDPIGAAAGVGGAGGELAIVGSEDGTATLWRFISNPTRTLPLRPCLRLGGHKGMKIHGVAVSITMFVCATVSSSRCCIFSLSNGAMLCSISPPDIEFPVPVGVNDGEIKSETVFADSNAVSICASGFITLVCQSKYFTADGEILREIVTLELFTLEGTHIGSKPLESWRGIPNKIVSTFDGRGIIVCGGGGTSVHLVSAAKPLLFVDEWKISRDDEIYSGIGAYDIDFGPSISRPVVAVAGLSSGALRIHALKGISEWSEENKKRATMTEAVGSALARPAEKVKGLFGVVKGKGSGLVGLGKEIGREAMSNVKGGSVSGFLGDVFKKEYP